MLFSAVIPTFNRADMIHLCVDSVLAQTERDVEVIVVDDGSTDNTREVLRAKYGDRVQYIRQENAGPGVARNTGINAARGRYIAFLDSDDSWFPWTLANARRAIEENKDPAMVVGESHTLSKHGDPDRVTQGPYRARAYEDFITADVHALPSYTVVRTDLLRSIGGFTTRNINAEDVDVWLRLGDAKGLVKIMDPVAVYRREGHAQLARVTPKVYAGIRNLIDSEKAGKYAGGDRLKPRRVNMVYRYARAVSLNLVEGGKPWLALRLYMQCLPTNLRLGRFGYLATFPLYALIPWFRPVFYKLAPGSKASAAE